jgi:ABC-2 type transport system ATP-binding protein
MRSPLSGKIRIDTSKSDFQSEISRIFKELPVQDLNIQTLDIESVIKQIYQHKLK